MSKFFVFVAIAASTICTEVKAASVAECSSFFKSVSAQKLVDQMKRLSSLAEIWPGYRPENQTAIVTQDEPNYLHCALVFRNGKLTDQLILTKPLQFDNGLYGMYIGAPIAVKIPDDLISFLHKEDVARAIFYNHTSFPDSRGQSDYQIYMHGKNDFHLNVIVHEGFHMNSLFGGIGGERPFPWPSWDLQHTRDIAKYCYVGEEWAKESFALNSAYKILFLDGNIDMAKSAAKDFIRWREARYKTLSKVKVPSQTASDGVGCEEVEAILELEEGSADFVGTAAALELGAISRYQVSEHMVEYHDWYYRSALAQLLIMRKLNQDESLEALRRLSISKSWNDGIFAEFKKFIGK